MFGEATEGQMEMEMEMEMGLQCVNHSSTENELVNCDQLLIKP